MVRDIMVEYTREKILPEDLIQKTNLQQHNFMIDAINDIDVRQGNIEDVTNINIDDITILKTGVVALSNEKLDKADIDADLHFGEISVSREGTAVIMSLDVLNPTTGITTPISFTIPGATAAQAGVMDASSVAWISEADDRISALEGLSDVKAVADIPGTPTQAQLTAGWVAVAGKNPETGDILQDINNAKLWVFVGTDWVLYGTIVTVPLATTSTIGGVRDTSLTAPGNRWYVHVEADGRLALIGGNSLSTLIDTTIPAMQSTLNNTVKLTENQTISGIKDFMDETRKVRDVNNRLKFMKSDGIFQLLIRAGEYTETSCINRIYFYGRTSDDNGAISFYVDDNGDKYVTIPMRPSPGSTDIINKGYLDSRLATKQDTLTFDNAPTSGSARPVTSGGVYSALASKQNALTFDNTPASGSANPVKSGGVYDALAGKANLATTPQKGDTITTGYGVTLLSSITGGVWRQCQNSSMSTYVTAMVTHQMLYITLSPDGGTNTVPVCRMKDTLNGDGEATHSFIVPAGWYYKVDFESGRTCDVVEQPLIL